MPALRGEPLDGDDRGAGDSADGSDAGPGGATVHMDGAGAAQTDPAAEFGPREADLITDRPQQRRVIGASN